MSKKLVVGGDAVAILSTLLRCSECPLLSVQRAQTCASGKTCKDSLLLWMNASPLTPAQERAGSEEEWVVVRKDRLFAHLEKTYCIGCPVNEQECPNATMNRGTGVVYVEAGFRKECLQRQMKHLTTPDTEKEAADE